MMVGKDVNIPLISKKLQEENTRLVIDRDHYKQLAKWRAINIDALESKIQDLENDVEYLEETIRDMEAPDKY